MSSSSDSVFPPPVEERIGSLPSSTRSNVNKSSSSFETIESSLPLVATAHPFSVWISFVHAHYCVFFIPLLLLWQADWFYGWSQGYLTPTFAPSMQQVIKHANTLQDTQQQDTITHSFFNYLLYMPTTLPHFISLTFSCTYFFLDFIFMYTSFGIPLAPLLRLWYTFHHIFCTLGLFSPLVNQFDANMMLFGFWIGEISNPPLQWADMIEEKLRKVQNTVEKKKTAQQQKSYIHIFGIPLGVDEAKKIRAHLFFLHQASFPVFRVACFYYYWYLLKPFALLWTTHTSAVLMLFLSFVAVGEIMRPSIMAWLNKGKKE